MSNIFRNIWILTIPVWFALAAASQPREDIYIAGFLPLNHPTESSESIFTAVNLALNHINNSPHILKNYVLHVLWNDTQCNAGVGLKALFDMIHEKPQKTFLFGATCSSVTDQIAKAAKHWNLIQLSYSDTHPMFTEKGYPNFFRIVPSENEYNLPRLSLMRFYNWSRVGTLYQNQAKYALAHNNLVSELESNKFTVVESQSFNDEIVDQLQIFKDKDIRIILGNFDEIWARRVFCNAYHKGMYGRRYQWMIVGMYTKNWWEKPDPDNAMNCTTEQIKEAVRGNFIMEMITLASKSDITISQLTPQEYQLEYEKRTQANSYFHGYAYDGIYALAQALDEVASTTNFKLNEFQYSNETWHRLFMTALDRTSFEGVTGPVRFRGNTRRGNIVIKQFRDEDGSFEAVCVGEYSRVTRTLHLEKCKDIYWVKKPPKDRTNIRIDMTFINPTIFIIAVVIACIGILLALTFLAINIRFRHERQIKMSSPNMNNIIIIGCILTYISVILLGLDSNWTNFETFPYICTARAWTMMSGFTLSFGSMFSKTWRVHSIFTNVQLNKKVMKDYQLYLVVGGLVLIDVIIMTTWQVFDPFFRDTDRLLPVVTENDELQIIPEIEFCRSHNMTVFVGCIYAYKGVLMLFGAFLAWETRQVQIPALNDSKYVGISVYNVTIMCVLGVAVSFVLSEEQTASFIIIAAFIIFCNTGTLSLVFVPKIIDLKREKKDPTSKEKMGKTTMKNMGVAKFNNKPVQSVEDMLRIAKKVNAKLRNSLVEIEKEIALATCVAEGRAKEGPEKAVEVNPQVVNQQFVSPQVVNPHVANPQVMDSQIVGPQVVEPQVMDPHVVDESTKFLNPAVPPGARPSTTSTITSDYFSMNSKEVLVQHVIEEQEDESEDRTEMSESSKRLKSCQSFEDQATQTDDEEIMERNMPQYRNGHDIDNYHQCRSHEELSHPGSSSMFWCPVQKTTSNTMSATEAKELSSQMLPIFQRLIEDKKGKKKATQNNNQKARINAQSCPDISLKCDIVEYL